MSAFIKSMRGSDPDAAVYWMARMLEAGEDPLFVLRRMVIFAAEDVGVADPQALAVATAALDAFRFVGLPEGVLPMTQAALYLATAPKTNTALTTYAAAQGRRRRARRAAGAGAPAQRRRRRWPRRWAGAPATSTRTTSRATTSARSTCPTRCAAAATTSPPVRGAKKARRAPPGVVGHANVKAGRRDRPPHAPMIRFRREAAREASRTGAPSAPSLAGATS